MVTEIVAEVADVLPEHQTSRGNEFRELSTEEIIPLAQAALIARYQARSPNSDWESPEFRREIRRKKKRYFYHAGRLEISMEEAESMWWSYVHENPAPVERNKNDLI